jgi:serine/threonine protein kinase
MSDAPNYSKKIYALHQRLVRNLNFLDEHFTVPSELNGLITVEELYRIYQTLTLPNNHMYLYSKLKTGQPHRLSKETSTLPRSLNFIIDPLTHDIYLILETKRKTIDGKDFSIEIFSGAEKSTKSAWRIDSVIPEKYANAVFYAEDEEDIQDACHEAFLSKKIQEPHKTPFLTLIIAGEPISKKGERRRVLSLKDSVTYLPYQKKISLYSKWAQQGDLTKCLNKKMEFNQEKINQLTLQLFLAIKSLHDKDIIHHDIKPENILLFKNEAGEEHLELTDFGLTYDPSFPLEKNTPLASFQYASPEISAAHFYLAKEEGYNFNYFHNQQQYSLYLKSNLKKHYTSDFPKENELYIQHDDKTLHYVVLSPNGSGKPIYGKLKIHTKKEALTEPQLQRMKYSILALTFKKGHTRKEVPSFGRALFQKNSAQYAKSLIEDKNAFSHPNKSNDMWAIGIVLYELYNRRHPTPEEQPYFSKLIAGLLHPDRKKRFTVEQALLMHYIETDCSSEADALIKQNPGLSLSHLPMEQFENTSESKLESMTLSPKKSHTF